MKLSNSLVETQIAWWRIIKELTLSQMRARYRRTFAGFLWVTLNPIILYSVQSVVFKYFLKLDLANYPLFLLGGLLPWTFLMSSLDMGIPVLQSSRDLLLAFKISPSALVFSSVFDNCFNFLAAFLIVLLPAGMIQGLSLSGIACLPVACLTLFLAVAPLTVFLATLNVFYRDTRFVAHFLMSVLFYVTPIFYPAEILPEPFRQIVTLNPLFMVIEPVRICVYNFSLDHMGMALAKALVVDALLLGSAAWYWKRKRNAFYYYL